ncbi:MAG: ATPase, T2SS/T4P/T4SS family [Actinomycetota bacterium]|nr:ATPase, T2SS/T4P/T4SS family [Actinomycetota bacterium]MDA2971647.1 ATPase, T2SS/T4P/T4SS family [Actinomycetota bacterium]MDA3000229.1 ATPase, T2SS/T4P/T4SS family [Actinomycetota bacterium]
MSKDDLSTRLRGFVAEALVEQRHEARSRADGQPTEADEESLRAVISTYLDRDATQRLLGGQSTLSPDEELEITRSTIDHFMGLGPLQRLLDDPDITDIHVRGTGPVWVKHRDGNRTELPSVVDSDDELIRLVRNASSRSSRGERRFDASTVECNLCLPDGSRLFAVMDVSASPSVVIRKHQFALSSLDELHQGGLLTDELKSFFRAAVRARRNIIVAGGTGSGKTTLLRALINEIPRNERIVTIEDAYELGIDRFADLHPDFDTLQSRPPNIEGCGEIALADLTRMALRMDPDRVVVGEVRGSEAFPMLLAMSQGNNGSMCTIHADSTRSVFPKLAAYVSMANTGLPVDVVNLVIANAVHLVVHIELTGGVRRISSVREVVDADGPRIISNEIFEARDGGTAEVAYPMTGELRELLLEFGFNSSSSTRLRGVS